MTKMKFFYHKVITAKMNKKFPPFSIFSFCQFFMFSLFQKKNWKKISKKRKVKKFVSTKTKNIIFQKFFEEKTKHRNARSNGFFVEKHEKIFKKIQSFFLREIERNLTKFEKWNQDPFAEMFCQIVFVILLRMSIGWFPEIIRNLSGSWMNQKTKR